MSREIDAAIAEKVMGLGTAPYHDMGPKYSSDIAAAWQVVEKLDRYVVVTWHPRDITPRKAVVYVDAEARCRVEAQAETMPMAICLAALKAVGVEIPHPHRERTENERR